MLFEREDWKLFRNLDTLPQKAGVSRDKLPLLVGKELVDNALDICGSCQIGFEGDMFYIRDDGPGIDIDRLQEIFSINRPLISSKYLRMPTRGALGNGLRVVAGTVTATGGELIVSTKGCTFKMTMRDDGSTKAQHIGFYTGKGTMISLHLGSMNKVDPFWAKLAIDYAIGESYKGKTSPYWYNSESFFELFQAFKGTVRELVEQFDGCTGAKAGKISRDHKNRTADTMTFPETEKLLAALQKSLKPVKPERLGYIGELGKWSGYCKSYGTYSISSTRGSFSAEIPFVVEAWTNITENPSITALVNKSPIAGDVWAHGEKNITIYGCGLYSRIECKPADILLNIISPYIPITTDGKEPDLNSMAREIEEVISRAVNRAKRKERICSCSCEVEPIKTQKEVVLDCLESAIAKASGDGEYRFSQRQLYYAVRPYVLDKLNIEIEYDYFCQLITNFEQEKGDIKGMYRDPRGTLYTPHTGERIPIGTISVEKYCRPELVFNKVIYCEKEGFFEILTDVKFPERYDCALLTSKGFASRAVKDLLDLMGDSEEELMFFCVHDADAYGTKIYETLQAETKARPGRKVSIINLGLDPWEAIEMDLEIEKAESKSKKPVAGYVPENWAEWLQKNRVELNAMTTPQFILWLENKMQKHGNGKVIPEDSKLKEALKDNVNALLKNKIRDEILQKAGYDSQVQQASGKLNDVVDRQTITCIRASVERSLEDKPVNSWREPVKEMAEEFMSSNF